MTEATNTVFDVSGEPKGAFWAALMGAKRGDSIVYHVGDWCNTEHRGDAMVAYEGGMVTLVQRRESPREFTYIAQVLDVKPRKAR